MSGVLPQGRREILDNPHSDRVKRVAGLSRRSLRSRTHQIRVEGPQSTRELLRFSARYVVDVYLTEDAQVRYPEIATSARKATRWVHTISEGVAHAMSRDAQGVIAVASDAAASLVLNKENISSVLAAGFRGEGDGASSVGDPHAFTVDAGHSFSQDRERNVGPLVILVRPQDPGNAGTIIRTADALGACGVVITEGSVDVCSSKVIRSSAGSLFHLPIYTGAAFGDIATVLKNRDMTLLGTSGSLGSINIYDFLQNSKIYSDSILGSEHAWVFGNEARGLSPEEMDLCNSLVYVPIDGKAESLNISSAASICLFASQYVRKQL